MEDLKARAAAFGKDVDKMMGKKPPKVLSTA